MTTTAATTLTTTPTAPATTPSAKPSVTAELRLALIAQIVQCEDLLRLRTLQAVLDEDVAEIEPAALEEGTSEPAPDDGGGLVGDDEIIGYRPDGTPVRPREAVKSWDEAVADVLAGNGMSLEEVKARVRARVEAQ